MSGGIHVKRIWFVLTAAFALLAGSTAVPAVAPTASAANTLLTNPLGFAYGSVTGVAQYAHPSGMLVTGRCDRYAPEFASARANGAEILAYLNAASRPDSASGCALDNDFYLGDPSLVPLWPYPTDNPGTRVNWPNTHMTDITAGSAWADHVVAYVENLIREDKVDGVFLDVIGARPWATTADWDSWTQTEKDAWANGGVDIVRRIDAKRRAINPRFIVVNNNAWDINADTPGNSLAAEQYVDGICIEHHPPTGAYHQRIASKPYGNLGHRRLLIIANTTTEAQQWTDIQGVTHVSDQHGDRGYQQVTPPPTGFNRLTDRPKTFGRTDIAAGQSGGMTADQKRGSKFTLPDKATLLSLSAYLDGLGGVTGSQSMRMALYKDSGGVPAGRWAQSSTVTIAAGTTGRWVNFTVPATALDPGDYWIILHTGATQGVARYYADAIAANRYGNLDAFADGSSNPFGAGTSGNLTLSLKATYTVGY
jgi:hypothetical protein